MNLNNADALDKKKWIHWEVEHWISCTSDQIINQSWLSNYGPRATWQEILQNHNKQPNRHYCSHHDGQVGICQGQYIQSSFTCIWLGTTYGSLNRPLNQMLNSQTEKWHHHSNCWLRTVSQLEEHGFTIRLRILGWPWHSACSMPWTGFLELWWMLAETVLPHVILQNGLIVTEGTSGGLFTCRIF